MNPLAVTLMMYLCLALESAVRTAVAGGGVSPYFVLPAVVMVAMFAPVQSALWTGLLAGLATDLLGVRMIDQVPTVVVGPHALGYLAAAYFTTTIRGMMMKRSIFAWVFVAICAGGLAQCTVVVLMTVRSWVDGGMAWTVWGELGTRLFSALYGGAVMAGFWLCSRVMLPIMGLNEQATSRGYGRMMR
ncbi:MAG: hypothetical protein IBJ18_04880 [Phycisphaerales bacterium]|nr:hypothetical protein [Phycisphaerales bacterium]